MKDSKQEYIRNRIARSEELYADAQLLADNKSWRSCINRLYYSSFHLVNALLFSNGINSKSHEGQKTQFLQNYVKTGVISTDHGKLYAKLVDWRQESDYGVYSEFSEEDVLPILLMVNEFNQLLKSFLEARG